MIHLFCCSIVLFEVVALLWNIEMISFLDQIKGSDTSTTESGSEAEDITSPNLSRNIAHARLTPVREEVC